MLWGAVTEGQDLFSFLGLLLAFPTTQKFLVTLVSSSDLL